jgi:hypothetical protein
MLRMTIAALSLLIAFGPAVAGDRSNHAASVEVNGLSEELRSNTTMRPSDAFSSAAHNAMSSQQNSYVTGNAATTIGVAPFSSP